jgi:hypothetical protein
MGVGEKGCERKQHPRDCSYNEGAGRNELLKNVPGTQNEIEEVVFDEIE